MAVRGADHGALARHACALGDEPARLLDDAGGQARHVAGDQRRPLAVLFEHDGLGVQIVMHALGAAVVVVARHGHAGRRRDAHRGAPHAQFAGGQRRGQNQQGQQPAHGDQTSTFCPWQARASHSARAKRTVSAESSGVHSTGVFPVRQHSTKYSSSDW